MANIILPDRWNRQPTYAVEIDWNNGLTRNLRAAVNGISAYDAVAGKVLTSTGISVVPTQRGLGFNNPTLSSSGKIVLPFELSGAVSVHAVVSRSASVATGVTAVAEIASNRSAGQSTYWECNLGNNFGLAADKDKPRFSTNATGIGTIYADGVAMSGNNPGSKALTNGQFYGMTFSASSGASSSGSGVTHLLNLNNQYVLNGLVPLLLLWDRAVGSEEAVELARNPWQIFKKKPQILYFSAGSGSSVNLTGNSLTTATGTVTPSASVSASGSAATTASGTVTTTTGVVVALTGQSATASSGTVVPSTDVNATGSAATGSTGTVTTTTGIVVALTGQAATAAAGTITQSSSITLSGASATVSTGTVVIPGGAVSVTLAGQVMTLSIGNITVTNLGWNVVGNASNTWAYQSANTDSWAVVANASGSWTIQ